MNDLCKKCGKELTGLDQAFYRKMVNRGATEFLCLGCTSQHFQISEERAHELIEHFRMSGCTLFAEEETKST